MNTMEVMRRVLTAYDTHDLLSMEAHMQALRDVMANADNPKMYWQSLTDAEHVQLAEDWGCASADWVLYAAAVERKVKDKQAALFESLIKEAQIASHAKRLALELESLLLATHDTEAVSTWWQSAYQAMHNYQDDVDRLYPQEHVSPLGKD